MHVWAPHHDKGGENIQWTKDTVLPKQSHVKELN